MAWVRRLSLCRTLWRVGAHRPIADTTGVLRVPSVHLDPVEVVSLSGRIRERSGDWRAIVFDCRSSPSRGTFRGSLGDDCHRAVRARSGATRNSARYETRSTEPLQKLPVSKLFGPVGLFVEPRRHGRSMQALDPSPACRRQSSPAQVRRSHGSGWDGRECSCGFRTTLTRWSRRPLAAHACATDRRSRKRNSKREARNVRSMFASPSFV